jgi:hypothetical protein
VGSALPAASVARTSKLCDPSASAAAGVSVAPGPEQARKASRSKRHLKLDPGSLEENAKLGLAS